VVSLPLLGIDVPLGREQFEALARPILDRTMMVATSALAAARVSATDLAAIFPVDGSSRIPLVATLLHRALSVAPVSIEEPQLAIALGSLVAASGPPAPPAAMGHPTPPHGIVAPVSGGPPVSGAPPVMPRPMPPPSVRPPWPQGVPPPYRS
jgi:hypothetical protein